MQRIYGALIEITASAVFIIPIFLLYGKFVFYYIKHTIFHIIFAFYLVALLALTGFPNITNMHIDFTVNVIPFAHMASDFINALLNIILFVPMGAFLPVLSNKFRVIKHTLIFALCTTLFIEFMQLFSFRTTDINDILTNMAGTLTGYLIARLITKNFTRFIIQNTKIAEVYLTSGTVVLIMFTAQPFISSLLWEAIL